MVSTVLLFMLLSFVPGSNADDDLHAKIAATYDFAPHNLDEATIEKRSAILDGFWTEVKALGPSGLDLLRSELKRTDNPSFFYYDGAKLLLSLSKSRADKQVALNAIQRSDLRDTARSDYFFTIHSFSMEGLNTAPAALRILGDPQWKTFIPQHALTLGQDYCLIYLLLPLDESQYVEHVIERLDSENELTALRSLMLLLAYTVNPQADSAIIAFADNASKPAQARKYAGDLIKQLHLSATPSDGIVSQNFLSLKAERRVLMRRISDEALSEIDELTKKIRKNAQ
jgi:hypothetical protein